MRLINSSAVAGRDPQGVPVGHPSELERQKMDTSLNTERRWIWVGARRGPGQWTLMNLSKDDPQYQGSKPYKPGEAPPAPLDTDAPAAKTKIRKPDA